MVVGVTRQVLAGLAVAVTLIGMGAAAPLQAQIALKLTLDGRIEGPSAPFLVALERGYFKDEGLEVTIEPSSGGIEPITRVASGAFDVGFGDINTLIRYRDQNPAAPVKGVFVVNNRPNYAVIGRKSRGVGTVRELVGKKLGAPAAEPATAAWPILAQVRGVDVSKVTVINVGLPVREPMLAAGEVDAITGTSSSSPINLRAKGVPADDIVVMLMGARGLVLYGNTIFVNTKVLAEKPDAVKALLRAYTRALKETVRDPSAAVAPVVRQTGPNSREVELERLRATISDSIVTPDVMANGLGDIDAARFAAGLDQLAISHSFKNKPKLEDLFDPAFLPPLAERKLD